MTYIFSSTTLRRGGLLAYTLISFAACGASGSTSDLTARPGGDVSPTSQNVGAPGPGRAVSAQPSAVGPQVHVDASGAYSITFQRPGWTFSGSLGVPATQITNATGQDTVGPYHEVTFGFVDTSTKAGGIRAYDQVSAAVFTVTYVTPASNAAASFPTFAMFPGVAHHASYQEVNFAPVSFSSLTADSPLVFFDDEANTFILSAASDFMNAATTQLQSGALSSGIDPAVTDLPAGFSHRTALVAAPGINATYGVWGGLLTNLSGKTRIASDATPYLEHLGYWTDIGAYYFYNYDTSIGYPATLTAVRDYFTQIGVPLAYMQLDSWWYPKGADQLWSYRTEPGDGAYLYEAAPALFPEGLAAFQQSLGLPLVTHARWIDTSSPYRTTYAMSNNVPTDPAYWSMVASYLADAGVAVYEQDWLATKALPVTSNLTDQDAFMDGMANKMAESGLGLQYCMPLPRHYLQGSKYANLTTTRVSGDRFGRGWYRDFLFTTLLTSALGAWPWVDTFNSTETDNLLLATLSGGMVGVGDEIGAASVPNLLQAVRPDGVIVKPDVPIAPTDATFINLARGVDTPLVASSYSDFGGWRASYVFAFNVGTSVSASFTPAALGYTGQVFVYNYYLGTGRLVDASAAYTEDLGAGSSSSYYVIVPLGASGIAFAGDSGKFVSLGKKRITQVSDDGTLSVSVAFASGESSVTLHGYATSAPSAIASTGSAGDVTWDATTNMFTVTVVPDGGMAAISLR